MWQKTTISVIKQKTWTTVTKIKYNDEIKNDPSTTTTVCTHVCIQSLEKNKLTQESRDWMYEWETELLATLCSLPHFHSNFPPQFEKQKAALSAALTFLCSLPHRLACNDTQLMRWADGTSPQGKQTVILGEWLVPLSFHLSFSPFTTPPHLFFLSRVVKKTLLNKWIKPAGQNLSTNKP